MATNHVVWSGLAADKLYQTSAFSNTVLKNSVAYAGVDETDTSYDADGDIPHSDTGKSYLQSQFTSTIKTSHTNNHSTRRGIGTDGATEMITAEDTNNDIYFHSGLFSSALRASYDANTQLGEGGPEASNFVGDTLNLHILGGNANDKAYYVSGRETAVLRDSQPDGGAENFVSGADWDGTDHLIGGANRDQLVLTSGLLGSVIRNSADVTGIDNNLQGLATDDATGRLAALGGAAAFAVHRIGNRLSHLNGGHVQVGIG